jgi:putative spermidine/putrescine transport system permease protein
MSLVSGSAGRSWGGAVAFFQVTPLALILTCFILVPLMAILAISFLDTDGVRILPRFVFDNYTEAFQSQATWKAYLNTLKYAAMVWAVTLLIGFFTAYFITFHVRTALMKTLIFVLCTIPFFTSNLIRTISWVPLLGREGLINGALLKLNLISAPIEGLLYSDFAIVLVYTYLFLFFMVSPIFNSMARIDRSLIEAATGVGAPEWRVIIEVILPLCKSGIAIGSIFVITLVMGDFITVQLMGGGQRPSVALLIYYQFTLLQYPAACANAVLLLAVVLALVAAITRVVNLRRDL